MLWMDDRVLKPCPQSIISLLLLCIPFSIFSSSLNLIRGKPNKEILILIYGLDSLNHHHHTYKGPKSRNILPTATQGTNCTGQNICIYTCISNRYLYL